MNLAEPFKVEKLKKLAGMQLRKNIKKKLELFCKNTAVF